MIESMAWLPDEFLKEMKNLLGSEYEIFLDSYKDDYYRGIRFNTLKVSPSDLSENIPFIGEKVSWTDNGYYVNEDEQPAKHPYYFAGLYYIQEPSAMLPAALLPVEPGDKVLDLCAAPGGKTTELGAKLKGDGLLVSNDISVSRAKALLKNVELFGIKNAVVVSEPPDKLAERFPEYFDRILVDAPCSGEGMFRKVHSISKNWEQYGSGYYADIQRSVLPSAVRMLKPGGYMIYSTCTFSKLEDEDSIEFILKNYPDMEIVDAIDFEDWKYNGFARGIIGGCEKNELSSGDFSLSESDRNKLIRLFPHKIKGEGHFVALLHKKSMNGDPEVSENVKYDQDNVENEKRRFCGKNHYDDRIRKKYKKISDEAFDFFEKTDLEIKPERLMVNEGRVFLLPEEMPDMNRMRVLRSGLFLGEMKTGRFEPAQSLAIALKSFEFQNVLNLSLNDDRVKRYLKCESIEIEGNEAGEGYCLVAVDGFPLGWGKVDRGRFKNKYLPSWRLQ